MGHEGKLLLGTFSGKTVMMMSGRFHYYEGYDMETVTFPVRVMKELGISTLLVSNAAGAMNPAYHIGDIMLLRDHVNLFPEHPLRGSNDERLGPRFPDMSEPYDLNILTKAKAIAQELDIAVREGIYVGLQGPTFETPAEYAYLRAIGGDAVGMSTIPEVIVAKHAKMKVFAASIITDIGRSDIAQAITHEEVLAAANEAAPKLGKIIKGLVSAL
jgi:purine-nucleoside phosphorylase